MSWPGHKVAQDPALSLLGFGPLSQPWFVQRSFIHGRPGSSTTGTASADYSVRPLVVKIVQVREEGPGKNCDVRPRRDHRPSSAHREIHGSGSY